MALRRRQGISRSSTFKEDGAYSPNNDVTSPSSLPSSPSSSLASQAIRASMAHRDSPMSPLSSGYANSPFHSSFQDRSKVVHSLYLLRLTVLDKMNVQPHRASNFHRLFPMAYLIPGKISAKACLFVNVHRYTRNNCSLTCYQEGRTIGDKRTQDIKEVGEENRRMETKHEEFGMQNQWQDTRPTNTVHQLKASRDVAIATAAKAKLLLREIKTVEADLAFAKQRSSQLEEENKILREAREKGDHPADDDMIRLQLETLLAEKARLAHENSVYIRENSCLREIIEYHKLTMQDVIYLDEGIEEVAEVNPGLSRTLSVESSSGLLELPNVEDPPSYGSSTSPSKSSVT
ncbi:hypothetical protein OSB04_020163 [Centaurea solstitialis]|uniref:Uncharacterized protein n=1 Tax=Centaurea solstitialis TaxID=347529 RepID=A0AA38SRP6_9ASTR|nr:hypothetical protein OSB04_020163 [Centaurea solstitialis]